MLCRGKTNFVNAVIEGRADLALGAPEAPPNTQGLRYEEMMRVDWDFAVAKNHPLTKVKRAVSEADVRQYRAVVVRDSSRELPPLTRRVFDQQPALKIATVQHKIDAQICGLGAGFLPRHRIVSHIKKGELVVLPLQKQSEASPLHLARKTNNKGKALNWWMETLGSC